MAPWPLLFTGLLVNNMYYWATNQSIIQRTFGAKNLKEAQKGAVFAGFLKIMTRDHVVPGVTQHWLTGHGLGFRLTRCW